MDWVKVYESHTPFEWALQVALSIVEPWGEERADIREGRNATHIIASNRPGMAGEDVQTIHDSLTRYLKCQKEPERVVGARALRQALGDTNG